LIESKIKTQIKSHLPSEKPTNPPPRPAARPNTEIRSAAIPDGEVADLEKIALGFDSNAREARNEKDKCKPFQKGLRDQWAWGERSWTRQAVTIRQAIARLTALEAEKAALKAEARAQAVPEDFITHQAPWRNAIEIARDAAATPTTDSDDRSYWEHELRAFDAAYRSLSTVCTVGDEAPRANSSDVSVPREAVEALRNVIAAWDVLPEGHRAAKNVFPWLYGSMSPAIGLCRQAFDAIPAAPQQFALAAGSASPQVKGDTDGSVS
jgi:hypothetical protein